MPHSRHYIRNTLLGAAAILALTAAPNWQGSASATTASRPLDIRPPAAKAVIVKPAATRVHVRRAAPKLPPRQRAAPVETVEDINTYATADCAEANVPGPEEEFDGNLLWKCTYQWIMRYSYDIRDPKNRADWSATWRNPPLDRKAMLSRELAIPAVRAMVASLELYETDRFNHLDEPAPPQTPANLKEWADTWFALQLDHEQLGMPSLAVPSFGPLVGGAAIYEANRFKPFSVTTPAQEEISAEPVKQKLIDRDVNYVKLDNFMDDNGRQQFKSALENGVAAKASVYIIDLRKNRGGWIYNAEYYAELLMDQAIYGSETVRDGLSITTTTKILTRNGWLIDRSGEPFTFARHDAAIVPATASIVIIVDGDSASASEMLAGACRANGRCIIVGTASFGKDREQIPIKLAYGYSVTLINGEFHPGGMKTGWSGVLADYLVREKPQEMGNPEQDPALAEGIKVGRIDAANRASLEYQRVQLEQTRRGDYLLWRSRR